MRQHNKIAGNAQQYALRERLFIRKSALSEFFLRIRRREVLSYVKEIENNEANNQN